MKKNKCKNKLVKYSLGTYVGNPIDKLYQNEIDRAYAESKNSSLVDGLNLFGGLATQIGGNMMSAGTMGGNTKFSKFVNNNKGDIISGINIANTYSNLLAMGGQVNNIPVEVEGKEVGEMPNGQLLNFQGPSHEQGGIPISLPEGTEIYSKRIKVDGVSMADRKKKREKKTMTLESLFEKNKTDILIRNSLNRTSQNNEVEENADNKIQHLVKQLLDNQENPIVQNHKWGNPVKYSKGYDYNMFQPYYEKYFSKMGQKVPSKLDVNAIKEIQNYVGTKPDGILGKDSFSKMQTRFDTIDPINNVGVKLLPVNFDKNIEIKTNNSMTPLSIGNNKNKSFNIKNVLGNTTLGDVMGMAGNLYQSDKIMDTIMKNRAGDTPNINAFKDYGKNGLETLDKSKDYINQIRDNKLKDSELSRTSTIKRNNNSARSINTLRALNLATDAQVNNQKDNIQDVFSQQMMSILNQKSGMQNQQDQMVMQGEQSRDLADRQDRDNFYNQLITGYKNNGEVISQTGKDLNAIKTRSTNMALINDMSKYGTRNFDGTWTGKDGVIWSSDKAFQEHIIKNENDPFAGYSKKQIQEYLKKRND